MNQQYTRLIIILAAIIVIASGVILYLSLPLLTGETVVLKTQPVDPFDMFRGQYLTINYEISRVNLPENTTEGKTVYVSLKEGDDKIWHAEKISLSKPENGIFIRGTAKQSWGGLAVEYGIEQYFFERVIAKTPVKNLVFFEKQIVLEVLRMFFKKQNFPYSNHGTRRPAFKLRSYSLCR